MATNTRGQVNEVMPVGAAVREGLQIRQGEVDDLRAPFLPWSLRVPEPKTGRLDFDRYPFQRELYSDEFAYDREGVIKKATQLGVSAWLIRWLMFFADTKGWTAFYLFPKEKHMFRFHDLRIRPLIQRDGYLAGRVPYGYVNNKGTKQVGLGALVCAGSQNKDEVDSVDADVLGIDEYDRVEQANVPDAEQRISGSDHGLIRRVGVPTIPQYGIAKLYERSDKRKWMVKCRCKAGWQEIDFFKNVDVERERIVCHLCRKPLDVHKGQWVAEITETQRPRGYHISRLIVPHVNLADIIEHSKQRKTYERQRFFNKDLGIEYASAGGRITDEVLKAAQTVGGAYPMPEGYNGTNPVTMGVDMASVRDATVRISEHLSEVEKRALYIGEVGDEDLAQFLRKLGDLMIRYRVNMAAIDHLPDGRVSRAFASMFPGLVYVTALVDERMDQIIKWDDQTMKCSARRTESIDAMISMMKAQKNRLPYTELDELPEGYAEQMKSPQRFEEEDEETGKRVVGYISTGPDDYAMAETFDMIATELWWARQQVTSYFREQTSTLDDHIGSDWRSDLTDEAEPDYRPGPPDLAMQEDEWAPLDEEWPSY
jgi:Phage terminase large subunit (GpA)